MKVKFNNYLEDTYNKILESYKKIDLKFEFPENSDYEAYLNLKEEHNKEIIKKYPLKEWIDIGDDLKLLQVYNENENGVVYDFIYESGNIIVYKKEIANDFDVFSEARPKMIKHRLRKGEVYWSLKNMDDGSIRKLKQLTMSRLRVFLKDVNACDSKSPISFGMDYTELKKELINNGEVIIYIPKNRLGYLRSIYYDANKPYNNQKNYDFKD